MSGRIENQLDRRVNGVANKDALPSFRGELESSGGVDVNVSRAAKNLKIREVWIASNERRERDTTSTVRPRAATDEDHGEEGKSSKIDPEEKLREEELWHHQSLDAGQLQVSIRDCPFNNDVGGTTDDSE